MLTDEEALWLKQSSPIWLGTPLQLGSSAKLGNSMRLGNVIELAALLDLIGRKFDEIEKLDNPDATDVQVLNSVLARLHDAEDKTVFCAAVDERFIGE